MMLCHGRFSSTVSYSIQQESELKGEVVALLTDPNLYMGAYDAIFPQDPEPLEGGTFWPLIHRLARLGVYLVEGNDAAVNHTALAQNNPFREVCMKDYLCHI